MTAWGAERYGEPASKGPLEMGRLADLVILDRNPTRVPADAIEDIEVLETIEGGRPCPGAAN